MKSNFLLGGLIVLFSFSVVNAKEKETPQNWPDRTVLTIEPYQKVGKIAPAIKNSDKIDRPKEISAPEGAPNLLLIMIDDVGFGGTFAFGYPYSYSKF
ncbi:hypothetical protein [Flavobacterium sp. A45]|uniref:hypothetical protein n=1 Tax=Flavobacterium sp. A45 TaxID=1945862 RepID=UPI0009840E36|nr:hypothetical protein [Flavobacterium sp. A45]OOG65896.1 hypothetical protein B0E44_15295 [Flavobacterium sp. A45]